MSSCFNKNLIDLIREHKHNYAPDFGSVVMEPCRCLFKELLNNAIAFSEEEKKDIISLFKSASSCRALYDIIGLDVREIEDKIKKTYLPAAIESYQSLVNQGFELESQSVLDIDASKYISCDIGFPSEKTIKLILENPAAYTRRQKRLIIDSFSSYETLCTVVKNISKSYADQLQLIKTSIIPFIKEECKRYSYFAKKCNNLELNTIQPNLYTDTYLIQSLQKANAESEVLIEKLDNIQVEEYGTSESITIRTLLRDCLYEISEKKQREGTPAWLFSINPGNLPDVQIFISRSFFKSKVLDNIFKNFDDHAFSDFGFERERKVRVRFIENNTDPSIITFVIENNGKPFWGDTSTIFNIGVGEGTGIGLYSAMMFLKKYGGTIRMISEPTSEYTVGLEITLPIYHGE